MKKILSMVLAVVTVLVLGSTSAMSMEGGILVGVQGSFGDDSDFGVGVRGEYSLEEMVGLPVSAAVSADYFFPDSGDGVDVTWIEVNANALYTVPVSEQIKPYAGAGLNVAYAKVSFDNDYYQGDASNSDTEIGLNILGGAKFDLGLGFTPFAEFRLELSGGEQWVITGGVLF